MSVPLVAVGEGLRHELALLDAVVDGTLRFEVSTWRAPHALVVPRSTARLERFAEAARASADEGWPVFVRESGGGVVPLSPGVLTVAIVSNAPAVQIEAAYRALCEPLVQTLAELGVRAELGWVPGAFCDGAYNVVVNGKKLAGTAQRWRRMRTGDERRGDAVLAHAMLLVDDDLLELVGAVDRFAIRCGVEAASVEQHITLAQALGRPISIDAFAQQVEARFREAFAVRANA